ncbi:MAG: DUF4384 domain-containing protein [Alphaproteobacteria bacterium]
MSRLLPIVVVALTLAVGAAEAGDALVLESTEATLARGSVVKDGDSIEVAAGASVTLLGQDGAAIRIDGPHSGPIGAPASTSGEDLVGGLAMLFGEGGTDSSSFGAIRGLGGPLEDLWAVDLSSSGHRCVEPGGAIELRRGTAGSGRLRSLAGGAEATLVFAADDTIVPWPATLVLVDGADYGFIPDGSGSLVHSVVHVVPSTLPTTAHVAGWLARQGCGPQALALLDRLAEPSGSDALALDLSTPHGPSPVFKVGEALEIYLTTSRDAWVHCLYAMADGSVVGLFPNGFTGGPRLAGHVTHKVPRPGDGLTLVLSPPAGHETIQCFAWGNDPAARLPAAVVGADITRPIDAPFADLVADVRARGAPEAEASLEFEIRE